MSEGGGHIIINSLINSPDTTPEEKTHLQQLLQQSQWSKADRKWITELVKRSLKS